MILIQNTWVLYNGLQLLNQPWKHFASSLLMLANRSLLFKPLLLDILLLYVKLKINLQFVKLQIGWIQFLYLRDSEILYVSFYQREEERRVIESIVILLKALNLKVGRI